MDYIKYVLIAGLAAVSYLLLLAWQEDYPPVSSQTETQMENTAALPSDLPIEVICLPHRQTMQRPAAIFPVLVQQQQ